MTPKEQQPQLLPPTKITVVLRPHATEQDAAGLDVHLRGATLFVPEMNIGNSETRAVLERVAAGELSPIIAVATLGIGDSMRGYLMGVLQQLHQTKLAVAIADVAEDDPLNQQLAQVEHQAVYASDLKHAMTNLLNNLKHYQQLQSQREDRIVESVIQHLQANPQAQKIVMTMGSLHYPLVEKLRQRQALFTSLDIEVDAESDMNSSYQYDILNQLIAGQEVTEETLQRAVLEKLISNSPLYDQINSALRHPIAVERWIKEIVAQCSSEEIEQFYLELITLYTQRIQTGQMIVIGEPLSMLGMVAGEVLTKPSGLLEQKGIELPPVTLDYDDLFDPYV